MKTLIFIALAFLATIHAQATCGDTNKPSTCDFAKIATCVFQNRPPACQATVPTYTECCPSCYPPQPCSTCADFTTLPACSGGGPILNNAGCLTCQPKLKTCNFEELSSCSGTTLTWTDGCPSCIGDCHWDKLRQCNDGETPSLAEGFCPSCNPIKECVENCKTNLDSIKTCAAGEFPALDANGCCLTCVVRPKACSADAITTCANTYKTLPTCTGTTSMTKDFDNCCVSGCKCTLDFSNRKTCTLDEVAKCIADAPACKANEVPCLNADSCCGSCNTGGIWNHRVETVAKCLASVRPCAADERPVDVAGQPCKSCTVYPTFADCKCDNEDEICVYKWDWEKQANKTETKCISKKKLALAFKAVNDAAKQAIKFYIDNFKTDVKSAYFYLQTIFDKACSLPEYFQTCKSVLSNLRNIRVTHVNIESETSINIEIEVGDDVYDEKVDAEVELEQTKTVKRNVLAQTPSQFINSAVTNSQVNDVSASTTENAGNFGSAMIASFALIALCLLTLF